MLECFIQENHDPGDFSYGTLTGGPPGRESISSPSHQEAAVTRLSAVSLLDPTSTEYQVPALMTVALAMLCQTSMAKISWSVITKI